MVLLLLVVVACYVISVGRVCAWRRVIGVVVDGVGDDGGVGIGGSVSG